MESVKRISSELVAAIDIETVRVEENYNDLSEGFKAAWRYKHKQEGVIPSEDELADLWQKNASLYAEFSKVCAVSIAFLHQGKLYCKEFYGPDEKEILEATATTLNNMVVANSEYRLVAHAFKHFDGPFLSKRYVVNNIDIPTILDTGNSKPWEIRNLCTNELWRMGGTGAGSSLQALCNVLDIPVSKVDLVGDEVGAAYYRKEYERIGRYCSYDTVATFNIFRRFKKEGLFNFDEVTYVNNSPEPKKQLPPLQAIHIADYITDEAKETLKKQLSKKRLTKKDKEFIQDVLEHVYIKTSFMKEDTPEVRETKIAEIKELIKEI